MPEVAEPFAVAKETPTVPVVPPVRCTVTVIVPEFSSTPYVAPAKDSVPFGLTDEEEMPVVVDDEEPDSSSLMLSVAVLGEPRSALLVGFVSERVAVSLPSVDVSLIILTVKVLLVSLLAKVNVPLVTSKSVPAVAVPAVTA